MLRYIKKINSLRLKKSAHAVYTCPAAAITYPAVALLLRALLLSLGPAWCWIIHDYLFMYVHTKQNYA